MGHRLLDGTFRLGVGIEDTFVPNELPGRRALDGYALTQHYREWAGDLALVAASGAQTLRYGFPWYRLNPERGRFAWDWADRVVDALAAMDAEVIVDLVHYGTPLWLDNQFANRRYPEALSEYAYAFAERYGDRLTAYTPLNEPQWTARLCGESGTWPPMLTGHDGYIQVMTAVCRGIVSAQQAVRAALSAAAFVHVEASFRYAVEPGVESDEARLLDDRRFLATDLVAGMVDDRHPLTSYLGRHGVTDADLEWFRANSARPDVLGMNYYPMWSTLAYRRVDGHVQASERDDDVVGLEDVLRTAANRYGIPVMVTETSFEGSVDGRIDWLERSVAAVQELRREIPVVGYTWWPFVDQVMWQYREGTAPLLDYLHRLGLVALDPDDVGNLRRRPNAVFDRFRELAQSRAATPTAKREAIA